MTPGDSERGALGLHHRDVGMRGIEGQEIRRGETYPEEFGGVLDTHRAVDAVGDGAEEFDEVCAAGGRPRRLQDQPGSSGVARKTGALDHVRHIAVGDRDRDWQAGGDIGNGPLDQFDGAPTRPSFCTSVPKPKHGDSRCAAGDGSFNLA